MTFADAHITILWRSVKLSIATTILALIFGFPTAYFIATRPERWRDIWLFLITIPFWTNLLIRTFAIQEVIRNEGIVNTTLVTLGVIQAPMQIMYTDFAILMGMLYVYLPLMVLPLYASMERLDFRLVEAGYDLYANRFQVLRRIIIPLVKPGIIAGSILVFIPSLGAYVTPRVLGGGKNMMLGNLIDLQFGQGPQLALGRCTLDDTFADRDGSAHRLCAAGARRSTPWLGTQPRFAARPGFTTIAFICFVMLYLPIVTLVMFSFNAGTVHRSLGRLLLALV